MKHLSLKATVSSKGQVVIPQILRQALGIHAGSELILEAHDGILEAKPVKRSIEMLFGSCKQYGARPMSVKEMDEAIMEEVAKGNLKTTRRK